MDVMFICPNCKQQLEAESSLSGTSINCPACQSPLIVPVADPANTRTNNPTAASAGAKEEKHFQVPVTQTPTASLIEKPKPTLTAAKSDAEKTLHVKCIRRTDCVEVGKDHFDEVVTNFLGSVGETNIVSINTIAYTHVDMGSRQILTDYGVMIVFKG
jgi:hypothetical protein